MKPKYIIKAIEEEYVKLENYNDASHYIVAERSAVSLQAKEGDVVGINENGDFIILDEETLQRHEQIEKKFERLLRRGN